LNANLSSWFVIALAVIAANLPFANERLFLLVPLSGPVKSFWWRLVELFTLYVGVGAAVTRFRKPGASTP
jgi:hypothetical protein